MFDRIYIELSDICALSCSFCPHSGHSTKRGIMSVEFFHSVVQQITTPRRLTNLVYLHILGDPLRLENLNEYLEILKSNKLRVNIVSSGKFLYSCDWLMLLNKPIHQIAFSLSAYLDAPQNFFKHHIEHILNFCAFHQKIKSEIFVHLRLQDTHCGLESQEILERIFYFFSQKRDSLEKLKDNMVRLGYKIFLTQTRHHHWREDSQINIQKQEKLFCYGAKKQLGILSNGIVVPCCIDCFGELALGDLHIKSLQEILDSELRKMIIIGFQHKKAVMKKCQMCDYARGLQINTM